MMAALMTTQMRRGIVECFCEDSVMQRTCLCVSGRGVVQELGLQVSLEQAEPAASGAQAAAPTLIVTEAPPTVTVPPVAPEPTGGNTTSADAPRDIGMGIDGEVNSTPQQGSTPVAPTGKKTNWAAVGGGVAAVIVLLLLSTACFLIARRRRYRLNGKTMAHGFGGVHTAKPGGKSDHAALFHKDRNRSKRYGVAASNANRPSPTGLTTTAWDVMSAGVYSNITTSVATATTAYNTSVSAGETSFEQQKERLKTELDHMRRRSENFLRQYAVMPWTERREGGQGVVQFMRSARTEEAVAVKFFLSRKAFDAELELYQVDVLRSMMPAIRLEMNNADGTERNSRGYPWPPCIVIEKGESLQEWKAKTKPAFSTVVDVRTLMATCTPFKYISMNPIYTFSHGLFVSVYCFVASRWGFAHFFFYLTTTAFVLIQLGSLVLRISTDLYIIKACLPGSYLGRQDRWEGSDKSDGRLTLCDAELRCLATKQCTLRWLWQDEPYY